MKEINVSENLMWFQLDRCWTERQYIPYHSILRAKCNKKYSNHGYRNIGVTFYLLSGKSIDFSSSEEWKLKYKRKVRIKIFHNQKAQNQNCIK